MFAPVGVRRLKKLSGTRAYRLRCSVIRKTTISTAEATSTPIVSGDVQPTWLARVSPKTRSIRLPVTVTAPRASNRRARPSTLLSRTKRGTKSSVTSPIGTLTQKTHSQPKYSVRKPPARTPMAAPDPAMAPRMPSALLRSAPSRKVTVTIEKTDGARSAAAAPCRRRATMSMVSVCDTAHSSENAENSASPIMKILRRPRMSPARPPSSSSPPKVRA